MTTDEKLVSPWIRDWVKEYVQQQIDKRLGSTVPPGSDSALREHHWRDPAACSSEYAIEMQCLAREIVSGVRSPGRDEEKTVDLALLLRRRFPESGELVAAASELCKMYENYGLDVGSYKYDEAWARLFNAVTAARARRSPDPQPASGPPTPDLADSPKSNTKKASRLVDGTCRYCGNRLLVEADERTTPLNPQSASIQPTET